MRSHGTIDEVHFKLGGWCIRTLSYRYKLFKDGEIKFVHVDNHKQLREEISEFALQLSSYHADYDDEDEYENEAFMDE